MRAPPFELHQPASLNEALSMAAGLDNAKLLAGGQSLMAMMNLRYVFPDHLVDLNRIPELAGLQADAGHVRVGAMSRQRQVEVSDAVAAVMPILREALNVVGHRQTRNRGTIGGSLSHLDPAAELPALALLHDAEVHVSGANAARRVSSRDFMVDYMTPALEPQEIVTGIDFPCWSKGHGHAFIEVSRRHGDFAMALAGVLVETAGGIIRRVAIVVGGVDVLPRRLHEAEAELLGQRPDAALLDAAAQHAAGLACHADVHFTPDHRRHVAVTLVRRGLVRALARAGAA